MAPPECGTADSARPVPLGPAHCAQLPQVARSKGPHGPPATDSTPKSAPGATWSAALAVMLGSGVAPAVGAAAPPQPRYAQPHGGDARHHQADCGAPPRSIDHSGCGGYGGSGGGSGSPPSRRDVPLPATPQQAGAQAQAPQPTQQRHPQQPAAPEVPHIPQRYTWDCGLACVLMALRALGVGWQRARYKDLLRLCPTTSVWTIDLAHLLARFRVRVSFLTVTIGVDHSYANEAFYAPQWGADAARVARLFEDAPAAGVALEQRSVPLSELAALVGGGSHLAIVLVDKRRTDPEYRAWCDAAAAAAARGERSQGDGGGGGGGGIGADAAAVGVAEGGLGDDAAGGPGARDAGSSGSSSDSDGGGARRGRGSHKRANVRTWQEYFEECYNWHAASLGAISGWASPRQQSPARAARADAAGGEEAGGGAGGGGGGARVAEGELGGAPPPGVAGEGPVPPPAAGPAPAAGAPAAAARPRERCDEERLHQQQRRQQQLLDDYMQQRGAPRTGGGGGGGAPQQQQHQQWMGSWSSYYSWWLGQGGLEAVQQRQAQAQAEAEAGVQEGGAAGAAEGGAAGRAASRELERRALEERHGGLPYSGYAGHYLLLTGYDAAAGNFTVQDPAKPAGPVTLAAAALEEGRRAFGTDEDLLLIELPQPGAA